jgi:hypothetical protein
LSACGLLRHELTGRVQASTGPSWRPKGAPTFALALPDDLVEAVAERAAQLLAERPTEAEDGWIRGADRIAAYIDCPRSRVYALTSARRIPVHHDGSALIARRSELDRWVRDGGGVRP